MVPLVHNAQYHLPDSLRKVNSTAHQAFESSVNHKVDRKRGGPEDHFEHDKQEGRLEFAGQKGNAG